MICCNCGVEFKYSQIPLEDRAFTLWYQVVRCPRCSAHLRPTTGKISLLTTGVLLWSSIMLIFFASTKGMVNPGGAFYALLAVGGGLCFVVSRFSTGTQLYP